MASLHSISRDEVTKENRNDHPVVQHLQVQVANGFVLYANYKHYHWQTFGPLFRELHKLFDEFAQDVLGTIDELAERVRMIGPDLQAVQLKHMQEMAKVQSASDHQDMHEMIEEADANLLLVIKDMREGAKLADDNNDPGHGRPVFQSGSDPRKARVVPAPDPEEAGWTDLIRIRSPRHLHATGRWRLQFA